MAWEATIGNPKIPARVYAARVYAAGVYAAGVYEPPSEASISNPAALTLKSRRTPALFGATGTSRPPTTGNGTPSCFRGSRRDDTAGCLMLFQQRFHGSAICRVLGGMPLASPQQREQFVDLAPLRLTKRARPLWTIMLGFGISLSGQRRGGNASDQRQITLTRSDRTCLIRLAVRQWVRLTDMHGGPYTPQLLLNFPILQNRQSCQYEKSRGKSGP
jgi:hypothetical protein